MNEEIEKEYANVKDISHACEYQGEYIGNLWRTRYSKKKKKEKEKEKNGFQVNHKSSRCFADRISLEDFPKKIGERDLFMKISRVISDVAVFVERVQ